MRLVFFTLILLFSFNSNFSQSRIITENEFKNCIELSNKTVRVVLEPNIGGRVLKYELNGINILYVD